MGGAVALRHLRKPLVEFTHQGSGFACKRDHLVAVSLAVHHSPTVRRGDRDAVDPSEREPPGLDRRVVGLRHLVMTRVCWAQVVDHRRRERLQLAHRVGRHVDTEMRCLPAGSGQFGCRGQHHRVWVLLAHLCDLGKRGRQQVADVIGPREEVADRFVLNRDRRIFKTQKMFGRRLDHRLENSLDRTVVVDRGDDEPVAQVEVRLPVDGVVLVTPGHVPDGDSRDRRRRVARFRGAEGVLPVVPLDEQRHR